MSKHKALVAGLGGCAKRKQFDKYCIKIQLKIVVFLLKTSFEISDFYRFLMVPRTCSATRPATHPPMGSQSIPGDPKT